MRLLDIVKLPWILFCVAMLASGAFVFMILQYEVGRLMIGSDIHTAPPNWLFLWGCVAIFAFRGRASQGDPPQATLTASWEVGEKHVDV